MVVELTRTKTLVLSSHCFNSKSFVLQSLTRSSMFHGVQQHYACCDLFLFGVQQCFHAKLCLEQVLRAAPVQASNENTQTPVTRCYLFFHIFSATSIAQHSFQPWPTVPRALLRKVYCTALCAASQRTCWKLTRRFTSALMSSMPRCTACWLTVPASSDASPSWKVRPNAPICPAPTCMNLIKPRTACFFTVSLCQFTALVALLFCATCRIVLAIRSSAPMLLPLAVPTHRLQIRHLPQRCAEPRTAELNSWKLFSGPGFTAAGRASAQSICGTQL